MSEFVTSLDQALDRLRRGEMPAAILPDYPAQAEAMDDLLTAALALEPLRPVLLPSLADLAADREQFLAELDQLAAPTVSRGPLVRLKGWIAQLPLPKLIPTFSLQEQRRMNSLIVITLIVSLVFGSAGGVIIASANSLPGSALYPVKTGLEEARLGLTTDPVQRASQWQERVQERAAEIAQMARQGQAIGEVELARLQTQTQACLEELAGLPDPALTQQLEQLQQMTQQQQGALEQAGVQAAVQTMNQAGQAAAEGLVDPAAFRHRYGHGRPDDAPLQPTPGPGPAETAVPTTGPEPTETVDAPAPTRTPGPKREQAGPPASPTCCTPRATGDANQYGPQPTSQPGPGQPGGNPTGQNTPTGDANKYGPQPTPQPGPGQPGGNPDGQNTPTGDANRYGPQPTSQPGPGQPGGNPTATCTPQPAGEANQNGQPQPGGPPTDTGGNDNTGGSTGSGGADKAGGSDSPGDSGGSSDSGGSGSKSDSPGGSGGSNDSGGSGDSGDSDSKSDSSGDSGGSSDSGGSGDSGGSDSKSGGSGGSGGSGNSGGSKGSK